MFWALVACAPRGGELAAPSTARVQAVHTPLVLVHETEPLRAVGFEGMLDDLATKQVVLVGETHLDDNTHRIERALLEGLERRKPGKIVLALEMFQRDVQPVLDAYLAGKIDEATFRERARPWPNYDTGYRPLVELARAEGIPVVAANLPVDLQRSFAMKGARANTELTPAQREVFPARVHPPHDAYWARLGHRLRDHFHGHDPSATPEARAYSVQNLWDNAMAEASLEALDADPERTVMLVAGAFHVEYGQGTAHQIRVRRPETTMGLATIVATHDLQAVVPERDRLRADYLLYTPARARGPQDGALAAYFPTQLEFRMHVPDAAGVGPLPLLVWLGDAGESFLDDQRYWEAALGGEAIIVTVEPPHPELTDDLRMSGRWWWPHRLERDLSHLSVGLRRMLELATDRFDVDPARVVVAGRGRGATTVLWAGLVGDLPATIVAWAPREAESLGAQGLPEHPPAVRRVTLVGADEALVETLGAAGIEHVHAEPEPEGASRHALEDRLRAALGASTRVAAPPTETMVLPTESPTGLKWAELHARIAERDGRSVRVIVGKPPPAATVLEASPEDFVDGMALPLAPGPFGGTTILVLPTTSTKDARKAWMELAERDVIKNRSRFASLQVTAGEDLPVLLETLKARGKRSMLIVPAEFVATAERMHALRAKVAAYEAELELHWLPGLGGELARARMAVSTPD